MVHLRFTGASVNGQSKSRETIGDVIHGKAITTKLSLPKIRAIIKKLNPRQRDLVRARGFGTMLDIKCSQLPRDLVVRLAIWFDCDSRTVNVPNVGSFEINPFTVHQILGIPLGGKLIDKVATNEARGAIAEDTGIRSSGPSISHLSTILSDDLTDEKFLRIFMLLLLSTFLCPTSHPCASPDYYNGIVDTDDIANHDWCSFALDWLVEKIRQFQISLSKPTVEGKEQSISLGGCLLIPLATFFDYLDLKGTKVRNCIPRLPAWDDNAINAFDNINFAQLKFKDISKTCFMQKPSCIPSCQSLPNGVAQFIDTLVQSDDDFRAKMKEMCTEFYKTSLDACFNALEPVLAKQMCTMVETVCNQVNKRASSSSTPSVNEFTNQECNSQRCTVLNDVPTRPLQTVLDTEFHNPLMGSALGMVESSGGGDICHGDLLDGDVVNGLLQLHRQGGPVIGMGDTCFGALVADQAVSAMSSEHRPHSPANKGNMIINASQKAGQVKSLVGDTTLEGAEFVQHGQQSQLAAYAKEVTERRKCTSSSPRGVDSATMQDSGMEDLLSAGTKAGQPESSPNVKQVSMAEKSMSADRRDNHGDLNMGITDEHIAPIATTQRSRISKRHIDLVCADSESGSRTPLKIQKNRSSVCGDK
ncbi:uncharacterized protein LOC100833484 isoform X2 [Brachypodium distachyon]|nr:uncharacterized protein LOC100833484 isoform X2 [Brachypodium distachyon]PNT72345.1 hypothetical protein BRADI_2g42926v3 [Brachypodium distachyon]|eukprot:XP_024315402.1 uncharacterized protein LOC100833484 isoform X2 [Brachypodium distachyon]